MAFINDDKDPYPNGRSFWYAMCSSCAKKSKERLMTRGKYITWMESKGWMLYEHFGAKRIACPKCALLLLKALLLKAKNDAQIAYNARQRASTED